MNLTRRMKIKGSSGCDEVEGIDPYREMVVQL